MMDETKPGGGSAPEGQPPPAEKPESASGPAAEAPKPAPPPPPKPPAAAAAPPKPPAPAAPKPPPKPKKLKVFVWPHMMFVEAVTGIVVILFFTIWSMYVNAPLEEIANPNLSPNPAKAPWYFLGLQELLVYFDPWIAGVGLPMLMIIGLMMIPYVDNNPRGLGYYTQRERPFAWGYFTFGLALWYILIVIGYWFRGPAWSWYWPWESWTHHKLTVAHNRNLYEVVGHWTWRLQHGQWPQFNPDGTTTLEKFAEIYKANDLLLFHGFDPLGMLVIAAFYAVGYYVPAVTFWKDRYQRWGRDRYLIVMFFVLTTVAILLKMGIRLMFSVKYVWVTPWFNI